ncbi:unnamed protein product (macronuclear) [Paramecium tetraurelia]|uniref:Uncharacterized protein n=1 Tax=Paramecium tetraurelia TaxID=5888 RepID=A0DZB9_PARTE|nr:uncharacterized protein GSPATT00003355001 [Paramecium tetraurelia]CAK88386.1 unnamed protein product [Paramecium tetraurelia]|eukprot:XP_001455783.1 hypothetical protein (macronuclear) [Paramecium tetraurelia strain d4-2]
MFLQGSKIKTIEATVNQQIKFSTRQLSQELKSSHSLHRRYSTVAVIHQDAYKIEDKYSKQLNQSLHTKYYNMHQLFKKKQYIPANFKSNNKPFEHVVTNQFSKTSSQLVQKKKKFNAKEWHKVNYDRFRFLSRQASIEKLVTNRQQSIQPCLQIQQANRQQRSVSQMNNYRTESISSLNNERCKCQRSNSLQKENLVIFLIEENQQNQKHD